MIRRLLLVGLLSTLPLLSGSLAHAGDDEPFEIRGTLPWHNFLSGPTAWNEEEWEQYLDWMQAEDLNLLTLHCYTGGSHRYVNYVEPMIRIAYRNVVPEAAFDTSLTARWGYRPLAVKDFAFGTGKLFREQDAFGSRAALLAHGNEERYHRAQNLIRRVIEMAHTRGIKVAMGFEFGVYPPELFSIVARDSYITPGMLPDPTHPHSQKILRNTIDDVLSAYPGIDSIWLWLQEHDVPVGPARLSQPLQEVLQKESHLFGDAGENVAFTGVWALAYIRSAHEYLERRAPGVSLAISGWGGDNQLTGILRGLDKGLPTNITFTCLSPNQGVDPQPAVLAEIAERRPTLIIPWLEGDSALWHPQPRVSLLRDHLCLAREQGVTGVVAIHWRTEDIRANMKAFARFAAAPATSPGVEEFYGDDAQEQYGNAGATLAPLLVRMDREQWFLKLRSPEYYPYDPLWGRLKAPLRKEITSAALTIQGLAAGAETTTAAANLNHLASTLRFTLLLDEVSGSMEPAYRLRMRSLTGEKIRDEVTTAQEVLKAAPVEELFRTYASRVRSRGELGVLSSMNQRLWLQYVELKEFLEKQKNSSASTGSGKQPGKLF